MNPSPNREPFSDPLLAGLLEEEAWVRRLAMALVRSADQVDDLVQETYLAALRGTGAGGPHRPTRAWIAGLVRNLARARAKGEVRRKRRERASARGGLSPAADLLLQRAEAQQHLREVVLELEEPLRSTVLMRFFDQFSIPEIAKRQGVRDDTVRRRLARARCQLESRLSREGSSGWAICTAVLGADGLSPARHSPPIPIDLLPAGPIALSISSTGVLLSPSLKIALGGLFVAVSGWLAFFLSGPPQETERSYPAGAKGTVEQPVDLLASSLGVVRPADSGEARTPAAPENSSVRVHGTVWALLPDGSLQRQPDGRLVLRGSASEEVRVEAGRFAFSVLAGSDFSLTDFRTVFEGADDSSNWRPSQEGTLWAGRAPSEIQDEWELDLGAVSMQPLCILRVKDGTSGLSVKSAQLVLTDGGQDALAPLLSGPRRRSATVMSGVAPFVFVPRSLLDSSTGAASRRDKQDLVLWVSAPYRTWTPVRVPLDRDSDTEVALAIGAELELILLGEGVPAGTELDLQRLDLPRGIVTDLGGAWYGSPEGPSQRLLLTGLEPGTYRAALNFSPPRAQWPLDQELGQVRTRVRPGQRTTVEVDCQQVSPTEPVDVEVRLIVPKAWKLEEFFFRISPLSAGLTVHSCSWTQEILESDGGEAWLAHPSGLTAGKYLVEFFCLGEVAHLAIVELDASQPRLDFAVPEPVEARVWFTDSHGLPLRITGLMVATPELEGAGGRATVFSSLDRASNGAVVFRAPRGAQRLIATLEDGRRVERSVQLEGSQLELVLDAEHP